jgi:hypothetical protein
MTQVSDWLLADCDLAVWNTLKTAERERLAQVLCQHLQTNGYVFQQWRFEHHGPDAEQTILVLTDEKSKLDFALIPGGTLLPGYDEEQLACYALIEEMVEGRRREVSAQEDDEFAVRLERWKLELPQLLTSEVSCDLRRKPEVPIAPFLMAVTPLLELPPKRPGFLYSAMHLRWENVMGHLLRNHWQLPTAMEFEWALQGGRQGIFYWGDQLPDFVLVPERYFEDEDKSQEMDEADIYDEETLWLLENSPLLTSAVTFDDVMQCRFQLGEPRNWPHYNRFGLKAIATFGCWCEPSAEPEDRYPLRVRGGAAECWPWQHCGEWLSMLSAAEGRLGYKADYGDWNTLRPVIRLGRGEAMNVRQ